MASLKELREERLKKVALLRELGIDPYPAKAHRTHRTRDIISAFEVHEGVEVIVTGRLYSWRGHGQINFGDLRDETGKIQLYIKEDTLGPRDASRGVLGFADLHLVDVGDFLEANGVVTKTSRGEISVEVRELRILTKSLRPLPDKWEGLSNQEEIFRRRYLDLAMTPERQELFRRKSLFWDANRAFMNSQGFLEVQTPIMELVPGGADARPFITHHNALDQDFYLRISPELYLKRLLGGGFEKVYTIGPNFRNEGIDDEHLQEFYAIEWYWAYANYRDNMNLVRDCIRYVAKEVYGKTKFTRGEHTFDLADEWQEIDYVRTIQERFDIDIFSSSDEEMEKVLREQGITFKKGEASRNRLVDNLWKLIRKTITGPAFLLNEPKFMSPLAKSKPEDPELTERFHVIIAGSELGNGYSELNDPLDQFERFREQQAAKDAGDEESQMMDIDYVEMLEYGMPPASGYAHSERLFDFLENITAREGTIFPQMKYKMDENTKAIYDLSTTSSAGGTAPQDFSKKIVIAVRNDMPEWQVLNTVGHISAYIGNRLKDQFGTGKYFESKDGILYPRNSQYPIIVVEASDKDLEKLAEKAREGDLTHHVFIRDMIETTDDQEIVARLKDMGDESVEKLGVGVFGPNEEIDKLTKRLKLWGK